MRLRRFPMLVAIAPLLPDEYRADGPQNPGWCCAKHRNALQAPFVSSSAILALRDTAPVLKFRFDHLDPRSYTAHIGQHTTS